MLISAPPTLGTPPESKAAAKTPKPWRNNGFPVVGLGASAGGLEALGRFFDQTGGHDSAAYVVIQHQDPAQPGMLPELLQRHTAMPVSAARNRARIRPGHVYVLPPNKDLSVLHFTLHLLEPTEKHKPHLPIDNFFRALAKDCRERAAGVILSGMGSDGTLGLRAIKENAGLTLAQDPTSAAFPAMPQSAIDAGLADIVAAPEAMPAHIESYFRKTIHHGHRAAAGQLGDKPQSALETIVILLRERTGSDFSLYKKGTLYRRIERRMALHNLAAIGDYAHFLRDNDAELDALFNEFLIGVTSFFRDPAAWESLIGNALPALIAAHPGGGALRAWVSACSTGEEAYSLAIAFNEALAKLQPAGEYTLRIFATDLDETAIEHARAGCYLANIAADVSPERLAAWFTAENGDYRVKPEIREMVIFARHNATMDPPFNRLDILCCRNLLIYLSLDLQEILLRRFHFALNHHGILMLGNAEGIGRFADLFSPIDLQQRIYQSIYRYTEHTQPAPYVSTKQMPPASDQESCQINLARSELDLDKLRENDQAFQEELRAANEELQSTNEDLMTSKEELQSLYEELQSTNVELQAKLGELSAASREMENLLGNTEIAAVFLDANLNVRRFTPNARGLFKLLPIDIGRPLSHIVSILDDTGLHAAAAEVLRTLVPFDALMHSRDRRHFRVRITPYEGPGHIIDGVVITFADVSESEASHATEAALRQTLRQGLEKLAKGRGRAKALEQLLLDVQSLIRIQAPDSPAASGRRQNHQRRKDEETDTD